MRPLALLAFAVITCGCATGGEDAAADDAGLSRDASVTEAGAATSDGAIAAPSCSNGTRDGDETDLDCGGSCTKCGVGRTCGGGIDCASGNCSTEGVCTCASLDHCPSGQSCIGGECLAALPSCAETKTAHASAPDGEYWVKPASGEAYRAYCDMQLRAEICSENGGAVTGKTREGSALTWTAMSKLDHAAGRCELWALKGPTGHPFERLSKVAGQTMSTCAAFGFKADGTLASCPYGAERTNCGFAVTPLHRYGNNCTGCTTNNGDYRNFLLQGPMKTASVLSNTSGTIKTTCAIR